MEHINRNHNYRRASSCCEHVKGAREQADAVEREKKEGKDKAAAACQDK
jgi:hypothetical protein